LRAGTHAVSRANAGRPPIAQDLSPGMWEMTIETPATGDAGWKPPFFNLMFLSAENLWASGKSRQGSHPRHAGDGAPATGI